MTGRFIVLEGPDGSGTTTNSRVLADHLTAKGLSVLHTFEATNGPVGTFIREHLKAGDLPGNAFQLLFTADRAWHEKQVLLPALEEEKIIICDRYSLSTFVYGTAQGFDRTWLEDLNRHFIEPDLLLMALPPFDVCMDRLGLRNKDSFEADDSLQKRVYDLYAAEAVSLPADHVFDTSLPQEETTKNIAAVVDAFLAS